MCCLCLTHNDTKQSVVEDFESIQRFEDEFMFLIRNRRNTHKGLGESTLIYKLFRKLYLRAIFFIGTQKQFLKQKRMINFREKKLGYNA